MFFMLDKESDSGLKPELLLVQFSHVLTSWVQPHLPHSYMELQLVPTWGNFVSQQNTIVREG